MAENGVILVSGGKYRTFTDKLAAVNETLSRMGDTTVAEVAAKGRRAGAPIMNRSIQMGLNYWKLYKPKRDDGTFEERGTFLDERLGGYASLTEVRNGRHLRETSFSFEKKKNQRSKGKFFRSLSQATMSSLVANLWEEDHVMGYGSEKFWWSYDRGRHWQHWEAGDVRRGRHFFLTGVKSAVAGVVPEALAVVEAKYKEEFEKL